MNEALVIELGQQTLFTILLMAAPMLGIGLIVGLAVSIFQAATQIQEQTLTFVPKLFVVVLTVLVLGSWMLNTVVKLTSQFLGNLGGFN